MFKKRVSIFACAVISLLCCVVTFVAVYARSSVERNRAINSVRERFSQSGEEPAENSAGAEADTSRYDKLKSIIDYADAHYLWDLDKDKMWEAIYTAALASQGDPYTYYMTADENISYWSPSGGLVGIGVRYAEDDSVDGIFVADVMERGAAYAAGIRRGDVIIAVDSVKANGSNRDELVEAVRGEPGSEVKITVLREGKELHFKATRAPLPGDSTYSIALDAQTWLICITTFSEENSAEDMISEIETARSLGAKKLIFDLRGNPGGSLDEVLAALDYLLPEGDIVSYNDLSGKKQVERSDAAFLDMPMAIICDGSTVSAAELFTAAMKDYKAAVIVGETTFGKGIMQYVRTLKDGSAISVTTSYYYPPSGVNYHQKGVEPDHTVKETRPHGKDYYLDPINNDDQVKKAYELLNG